MNRRPPRVSLLIGLGIVVAYVVTARMGLAFASVAEQVTTVWAPTGISIAALVLWGRSLWPAVWIGAFLANAETSAPLWTAAPIATGNMLEALVAAWILADVAGFDPAFRRTRDAMLFVVVAAGSATAISATVGATTLCIGGLQPWSRWDELWGAWWLGNSRGALVVGPFLLTIARASSHRTTREWIETALLVAATIVAGQLVFGQASSRAGAHPLEYVIFPFLIAAAVRIGQPATAFVTFAASTVTMSNTVQGGGPFGGDEFHTNLVLLQVFMAVYAGTGLILAAATTERKTGERRRAAAHAVADTLADAPRLSDAAVGVLRAICENLGWATGVMWLVEPEGHRLRCAAIWTEPPLGGGAFEAATRTALVTRSAELPGRVWTSGRPDWIEKITDAGDLPRLAAARDAGLRGAFAVPICVGQEVVGICEFFNRSVFLPDADLLRAMSGMGQQIGQFVARARIESIASEAQRRTRAILNTALDGIISIDHRGIITEFNPAAERMFGYTAEEAIGRELATLLVPDDLRVRHRERFQAVLATSARQFVDRRIDTVARHADGHRFPVEVSITRIVEDDPPRFTGFVRDLTAQAHAEREREHLLQRELQARKEAEAANRAKDVFLATLSHELRTPLNAIVGWTRMLLDGTLDEKSTRRALEVIERNALLQSQLVEDILDVSRIITGGLQLNVRPVDVGSVIGAALDAVRPAADAKGIRIHSSLAPTARLTEGDPQRLQQIVWNLLANAVKFTPPGGQIDVDVAEADTGGVQVHVRDNGAGIDPQFLPFVFERFRQADGSVSRQHGGLGLGLAIVRHLVELHGGTVHAESEGPGRGSSFVVRLPTSERMRADAKRIETSSGVPRPSWSASPVLAGCRALVVDDEMDARELLATMLTTAGAEVRTASSVQEALRLLDGFQADVLLADIGLPGEDGYSLIRTLRTSESGTGRRLPAAAITAYAGREDRERALGAGFDRHIAKPIKPEVIIDMILSLQNSEREFSSHLKSP